MFISTKLAALSSVLLASVAAMALTMPRAPAVDGTLHFCTGPLFSGNCSDIAYTSGTCYNFPTGFHDSITSITTQGRTADVCCYVYLDENCTGNLLAFRNDGPTDLGPGWDDTFDSVRCTVSSTCPL
ncbi:hypothetical protein FPV67DRAFT_439938 [Lyophyllum atratum]|nr:hypothetical protein FPV67DRAFT_439938 [Lyophyllum atratum]